MKPYKVKHVPTGLYYQPHKHRGSNVSKRGKIYETATHGLSSAFKYAKQYPDKEGYQKFTLRVAQDGTIHKQFKDTFVWTKCSWAYNEVMADTLLTDWILEEI